MYRARIGIGFITRNFGRWGSGKQAVYSGFTRTMTFEVVDAGGGGTRLVELPVIDGTYFKGVLRNSSYRIVRTFRELFGVEDDFTCPTLDFEAARGDTVPSRYCGRCLVCRVYGSDVNEGIVEVTEFVPVGYSGERRELFEAFKRAFELGCEGFAYRIASDDSVKKDVFKAGDSLFTMLHAMVSDRSNRVGEGSLFQSEYVGPYTGFYGEVRVRAEDDGLYCLALALILLSLAYLRHVPVGRNALGDLRVVGADYSPEVCCGDVREVIEYVSSAVRCDVRS